MAPAGALAFAASPGGMEAEELPLWRLHTPGQGCRETEGPRARSCEKLLHLPACKMRVWPSDSPVFSAFRSQIPFAESLPLAHAPAAQGILTE